jgi:hypothetical protein
MDIAWLGIEKLRPYYRKLFLCGTFISRLSDSDFSSTNFPGPGLGLCTRLGTNDIRKGFTIHGTFTENNTCQHGGGEGEQWSRRQGRKIDFYFDTVL